MAGDPIIDTAGRFEGFRGVGSDITEIRQTQERLTHLANVDVLSGLPNRGRVRQLLGEALRACDHRQCALRDHVSRPRRLQAGQRHVRPSQGRRRASRRRQAAGRRSRRRRPCRPHGRRRVRDRRHRCAKPQAGRAARRPHHQGDQGTLSHRSDRDPHRRLDRLRLRPDRRRDGRRSDPQGRPRALSSEGRRPRLRALFLVRAAVGAGGSGAPRRRPSPGARVEAIPPRLSSR